MPHFTVNICVLTFVLLSLQHTCHSRPHSNNKREIVKDYLNPLTFDTDQFEDGEDGKHYLKKSAYRLDSEVKYYTNENLEDKKNIMQNNLKDSEAETTITDETVQNEVAKNEPRDEMVAELAFSEEVPAPPSIEEVGTVKEFILPKSVPILEEFVEKVDISKEKAPYTPVDPKFAVQPKPDSKDEIALKTDLPPTEEEKVDEKVAIGQVPDLYSRLIPVPNNFRMPILIPVRQVSYGSVSVLPLPPAEASDRLPMSFEEDDIVGEGGHETGPLEDPESAADRKDGTGFHQGNPLAIGIRLPIISFSGLLKNLKGDDKQEDEKQSKIVDVLGKKFLMQSNVMKFPHGDNNGNTYIRFMSVKPLENADPTLLKETASEEAIAKEIAEAKLKGIEEDSKKGLEAKVLREDESLEKFNNKAKAEKEEELAKEPEILNVGEARIEFKMDPHVPKEYAFRVDSGMRADPDTMPEMKVTDGMVQSSKGVPESKSLGKESGSEESGEVESMEDEMKKALVKDKVMSEKGGENTDYLLKREDVKKEADIDSMKELFLVEKKNKDITIEEQEEKTKLKKKSEKKKKCKCEEKDSDLDDE